MSSTGGIIVVTDKYHSKFKEKFISYKNNVKRNMAAVRFKEMHRDGIPFLFFFLDVKKPLSKDYNNLLKQHMSHFICDFIMNYMRDTVLENLIKRNYSYFSQREREIILELTQQELNEQNSAKKFNEKKVYIIDSIQHYFQEKEYMNLEGFVNFRLKKIIAGLKYSVESSIDELLMEQEYQEFLKLLKYFVTLQEPKIEQVHITADQEGSLQLRDAEQRLLDYSFPVSNGLNLFSSKIQKEDFIISFLVNFAPKKIIVHQVLCCYYPKAVEAILNIFSERVVICKKCKLCQGQKLQL
ncbi:putative sporulation protein YtxC [Candidatus Contubernalis alkaliaceticus]|uniref:putative sporulation protein YtxC n=1 Tax=Candidatus Contubernalis alkaliaceticus TaxID=338645 RepID=UPI001F4C0719|nr:putative sporulation protein YtxC [Candidatus Contubernalis alkalaceticus]UNC92654.1 putative sporulation protein YtxC [Candidatus Contubernalis alkalaceticus]